MVSKTNFFHKYFYLIILLFKFFSKFQKSFNFNLNIIFKINFKKNLFFKKKNNKKILISKRLSIVIKKKKVFKINKSKKTNNGNFFFKKFFFKTLLNSRKSLKIFFGFNKKTRQSKISKKIFNLSKYRVLNQNEEFSITNILMKSQMFFSLNYINNFIKNNTIYINNIPFNKNNNVCVGDIIQLPISNKFFNYLLNYRKFFKKKLVVFKNINWKFFKNKRLSQGKLKKRKSPKFLILFCIFKINLPKYMEVDYISMSIIILFKTHLFYNNSYYLNKIFSYRLLTQYNFKKIN